MRHAQARLVHDQVAVHEQVEVDRPRSPALFSHPPQRLLDPEQKLEQRARRQRRVDPHRAIQEARLVDHPDRIGLAQLRHREHLDVVRFGQKIDGAQQRHLARADVRAEPDVCDGHALARSTTTAA